MLRCSENISILYSIFCFRNQMYIKSPGAGVGWNTFIGPFTPEMWVCTMAMILLAALVVAVTYHIGKKLNDVEDLPFTFGTTVFISFSGFFQQGIPINC